ncbi:VOC family protein [Marinomonas sp. IMCC 4694]|uniref:SMU1112c/YaeR family gloxylase I-like metalloprotein n=1 Tax=Marinomonas sp. IMCC 4694 TaxID=2605432 RepID=UPI0011E6FEF4|nr:VOC family protein [Marinomonas sp. IMCC 4694]TYL48449.1 VOC family protein [Marinomonas sp. IMCC 4694]
MFNVSHIHHIAIICSDYRVSKHFYSEILGFQIIAETYRDARQSYKLDLAINNHQQIELFSFPTPPRRPSQPEAQGLRHLAFAVPNLAHCIEHLHQQGVATEAIRIDELTGKKFTFFADPDGLPLELYEHA